MLVVFQRHSGHCFVVPSEQSLLLVTENGRLPEKLDESREVQGVIVIWFQKAFIDQLCQAQELALGQNRMVHVMLSEEPHQVGHGNKFLVNRMRLLEHITGGIQVRLEQILE